jgi:hypothetical protein
MRTASQQQIDLGTSCIPGTAVYCSRKRAEKSTLEANEAAAALSKLLVF